MLDGRFALPLGDVDQALQISRPLRELAEGARGLLKEGEGRVELDHLAPLEAFDRLRALVEEARGKE